MYTSIGAAAVNLLAHWTNYVSGPSVFSVQSGGGRLTGSCLRCAVSTGSNYSYISKTLDAQQTWGLVFALRVSALPAAGPIQLAAFTDAGTYQLQLLLNTDGTLQVNRGGGVGGGGAAGGTALTGGVSSVPLAVGEYADFELKVKIDPSAGTVELRKNAVAIIGPLTSQNTRATSNSTANGFLIGFPGNPSSTATLTGNIDWDDIILWDDQTTDANGFSDIHDFIGDCGLTWLLPTGAGTTTQFTPLTGSNFSEVNEATPDGDSSYVESSTIGQIDTYQMADLAASIATVKSVAACSFSRKTDVGSRGMKTEIRAGGGNTANAAEIALGNSYLYAWQQWGQNPNNGSAINWTPTTVNSVEAGQTVSS
jgi:hypothetical protein